MATIPTPEQGKPILDFSAGTFDGNSNLFQSRNGATEHVNGDDVADYVNTSRIYNGLETVSKTSVGAINEVNRKDASDIAYDNTASGLTATDVNAAIDEIVDDGYYHVGDTMSLLRTGMVAYSGAASLYFTIPLDKPVGDDVTNFSLTGNWRCILTNGNSLASSVVLDNAALSTLGTVTYSKVSNGVRVSVAMSSPLASWSLGTIMGISSNVLTFS